MKIWTMLTAAVFGLSLLAGTALAQDVYVRGYFKSDGTYVQPHYRSAPNSTRFDNWSTRGNVNPYTGQRGTRNLYNPYRSYGGYRNPYLAPTNPPTITCMTYGNVTQCF